MAFRVSIVSEENIRPSSPTPQTLRFYKLSFLDQFEEAPYSPIVLYYRNPYIVLDHIVPGNNRLNRRLETLKVSLSKTLTNFYPLAGITKDEFSIDCNDIGAYFVVARVVNTRLENFLTKPNLQLIRQLFPCETAFYGSTLGTRVTSIQVNVFDCHGIAIGLCISHKIVDGGSLSTFLKAWSHSNRGLRNVVIPKLTGLESLFPANDTWVRTSAMTMWQALINIGKCSTRRFEFDSMKLGVLRADACAKGVDHPTNRELVSALLWKCIMAAAEQKVGYRKPSILSHIVNLRKTSPALLSPESVGNLPWVASSECGTQSETEINHLVERLRDGSAKTSHRFVHDLTGNRRREVMAESLARYKDYDKRDEDHIGFTSWCDMGFYDVDFGWGKPLWVSGTVCDNSLMFYMNYVFLIETKFGKGIEAWVNINEEIMEILQHNKELSEFALFDPSPLYTR